VNTKSKEMPMEEYSKKQQIFNIVQQVAHTIFSHNPRISVEIYGSVSMGLALCNSDLDVRIIWGWELRKNEEKRILQALKKAIQQALPKKSLIKLIPARVPIIKFQFFQCECDISILSETTQHSKGNSELIRNVLNIDPRVKVLILAMKYYARYEGIGDATQRLLNSYGWTLLVISFLQNTSPPVLPPLSCLLDGSVTSETGKIYQGSAFKPSSSILKWLKKVKVPNTQTCSELFQELCCWKVFSKPSSRTNITVNVISGEVTIAEHSMQFQFHIADPVDTQSNVARALNGPGWDKIHKTMKL